MCLLSHKPCMKSNTTAVRCNGRQVVALRPTESILHVYQECSEEEYASCVSAAATEEEVCQFAKAVIVDGLGDNPLRYRL